MADLEGQLVERMELAVRQDQEDQPGEREPEPASRRVVAFG